jgi:hypothetical protein
MILLAQFDLDVFPPTANHIQQSTRSGRRYDTPEYKAFKAKFSALVGDRLKPLKAHEGKRLCLAVVYRWSGWFTKSGAIRKGRDTDNRLKGLQDSIFKAIGIDDAFNVMPLQQKDWPEPGRDKYIECRIYDAQGVGLWDLLEK